MGHSRAAWAAVAMKILSAMRRVHRKFTTVDFRIFLVEYHGIKQRETQKGWLILKKYRSSVSQQRSHHAKTLGGLQGCTRSSWKNI